MFPQFNQFLFQYFLYQCNEEMLLIEMNMDYTNTFTYVKSCILA